VASRFYLPASGTAAVSPAFDATWAEIITHNPSREFDADKLKHEITETLCALAVAGITDPAELQALTIASLEL